MAYRDVTLTLVLTLSSLAVALLIVLTLGSIGAHMLFVRPIGRLAAAARMLGAGDYATRSGLATTPGEIGELGGAFDAMAERLQARQQALLRMEASLRQSEATFRALTETMCSGVIVHRGKILYANHHAETLTGYSRAELLAMSVDAIVHPQMQEQLSASVFDFDGEPAVLATFIDITDRRRAEESLRSAHEGLERLVEQRTAQLKGATLALEQDVERRRTIEAELITRNDELTALNKRLADAQGQLVQSEKLASIGQLAAGVAHEINNPIGYVYSNLTSLEHYVHDALALIAQYESVEALIDDAATVAALQARKDSIDLAFLREDLPHLLAESHEGISRVRKIVQDLKDFSRVDHTHERELVDLHRCLDSTLNVVSFKLKYKADVVKDYGTLPEIDCVPSQLNQVFMNLLVNAAQAIEGPRGTITIRTRATDDAVIVSVEDTGKGIKREHLTRIFDPFFTTKPVGKGTGLGLSLVYAIIEQHGGRIDVDSTLGKGTVFGLTLPVRNASADEAVADEAAATIDA